MNILLYSHVEVSAIPKAGGIQRVTQLLANAFIERGLNCFHSFYSTNNDDAQIAFKDKIQLTWGKEYDELSIFLRKNSINFIIFQNILGGGERQLQQLRKATDEAGAKVIFCLHVAPDSSLIKPSAAAEFYRLIRGILVKRSIKKLIISLLPRYFYNKMAKRQTRQTFSHYNKYFDKIVLLSPSFIDKYCEMSASNDGDLRKKITAIPNPLTFDTEILPEEFAEKRKEVLILSRMSERQKRITDALKIWKKVQQKTDVSDWKLVICGSGEDEMYLRNYAKKLKLKNYTFEGVQQPLAYYKGASIYMLTSAWEGLPMTLLEAQQTGCVPVVFNNFSSICDVVENNCNGFIVDNRNITLFADVLTELMKNTEMRKMLAENGLKSIQQFKSEKIVAQWIELFEAMK